MNAVIEVTPAASARDLRVTVTLTNTTAAPLAVNTLFFDLPSVSLEVRTRSGGKVPKGPPPVPPVDDGRAIRTLAAGESLRLEYTGAALFGVTPPPGDYELRFRGWSPAYQGFDGFTGEVLSPWVGFQLGR